MKNLLLNLGKTNEFISPIREQREETWNVEHRQALLGFADDDDDAFPP